MAKYFIMAAMRDADRLADESDDEVTEVGDQINVDDEPSIVSNSEESGSQSESQPFNASGSFSKSTEKCVKFAVGLLKFWCEANGESIDVELMPWNKLNEVLAEFYSKVRTKTGEMYSVSSLVSFRYSLNRYFQSLAGHQKVDIIENSAFAYSNEVYSTVIKSMKMNYIEKNGYNKEKTFLTPDDLRQIYTKVFAIDSPKTLQFKVWLEVATYFTKCGRQKQRFLTKNSFVFGTDSSGRYVALKKMPETNAKSIFQNFTRDGRRMYEKKDNPLCPVLSLTKYLSKLNPNGEDLFQRPKYKVSCSSETWYYHQPVGKNYLGNVMSMICKHAGIARHISNKCLKSITPQVLEACVFALPHAKLNQACVQGLTSTCTTLPESLSQGTDEDESMNSEASETTTPAITTRNKNTHNLGVFSRECSKPMNIDQIHEVSGTPMSMTFEAAKQEIFNLFHQLDSQTLSEILRWIKNEDFLKEYPVPVGGSYYPVNQVNEYNETLYTRMVPHSPYPYNHGMVLQSPNYTHNPQRYPMSPLPIKPHTVSHYTNISPPTGRQHLASNTAQLYNYHGMFLPPSNTLPQQSSNHSGNNNSANHTTSNQQTVYDTRSYPAETSNYNNHSTFNMSGDASHNNGKIVSGLSGHQTNICGDDQRDDSTFTKSNNWTNNTLISCQNNVEADGNSTTDNNQHFSGPKTSVKRKLAEKVSGNKRQRKKTKKKEVESNDAVSDDVIPDSNIVNKRKSVNQSTTVGHKNRNSNNNSLNNTVSHSSTNTNIFHHQTKPRSLSAGIKTFDKKEKPHQPYTPKRKRLKIEAITPEPQFKIVSVVSMSDQNEYRTPETCLSDEDYRRNLHRISPENRSWSDYKTEEAKSYFNYLGLTLKPRYTFRSDADVNGNCSSESRPIEYGTPKREQEAQLTFPIGNKMKDKSRLSLRKFDKYGKDDNREIMSCSQKEEANIKVSPSDISKQNNIFKETLTLPSLQTDAISKSNTSPPNSSVKNNSFREIPQYSQKEGINCMKVSLPEKAGQTNTFKEAQSCLQEEDTNNNMTAFQSQKKTLKSGSNDFYREIPSYSLKDRNSNIKASPSIQKKTGTTDNTPLYLPKKANNIRSMNAASPVCIECETLKQKFGKNPLMVKCCHIIKLKNHSRKTFQDDPLVWTEEKSCTAEICSQTIKSPSTSHTSPGETQTTAKESLKNGPDINKKACSTSVITYRTKQSAHCGTSSIIQDEPSFDSFFIESKNTSSFDHSSEQAVVITRRKNPESKSNIGINTTAKVPPKYELIDPNCENQICIKEVLPNYLRTQQEPNTLANMSIEEFKSNSGSNWSMKEVPSKEKTFSHQKSDSRSIIPVKDRSHSGITMSARQVTSHLLHKDLPQNQKIAMTSVPIQHYIKVNQANKLLIDPRLKSSRKKTVASNTEPYGVNMTKTASGNQSSTQIHNYKHKPETEQNSSSPSKKLLSKSVKIVKNIANSCIAMNPIYNNCVNKEIVKNMPSTVPIHQDSHNTENQIPTSEEASEKSQPSNIKVNVDVKLHQNRHINHSVGCQNSACEKESNPHQEVSEPIKLCEMPSTRDLSSELLLNTLEVRETEFSKENSDIPKTPKEKCEIGMNPQRLAVSKMSSEAMANFQKLLETEMSKILKNAVYARKSKHNIEATISENPEQKTPIPVNIKLEKTSESNGSMIVGVGKTDSSTSRSIYHINFPVSQSSVIQTSSAASTETTASLLIPSCQIPSTKISNVPKPVNFQQSSTTTRVVNVSKSGHLPIHSSITRPTIEKDRLQTGPNNSKATVCAKTKASLKKNSTVTKIPLSALQSSNVTRLLSNVPLKSSNCNVPGPKIILNQENLPTRYFREPFNQSQKHLPQDALINKKNDSKNSGSGRKNETSNLRRTNIPHVKKPKPPKTSSIPVSKKPVYLILDNGVLREASTNHRDRNQSSKSLFVASVNNQQSSSKPKTQLIPTSPTFSNSSEFPYSAKQSSTKVLVKKDQTESLNLHQNFSKSTRQTQSAPRSINLGTDMFHPLNVSNMPSFKEHDKVYSSQPNRKLTETALLNIKQSHKAPVTSTFSSKDKSVPRILSKSLVNKNLVSTISKNIEALNLIHDISPHKSKASTNLLDGDLNSKCYEIATINRNILRPSVSLPQISRNNSVDSYQKADGRETFGTKPQIYKCHSSSPEPPSHHQNHTQNTNWDETDLYQKAAIGAPKSSTKAATVSNQTNLNISEKNQEPTKLSTSSQEQLHSVNNNSLTPTLSQITDRLTCIDNSSEKRQYKYIDKPRKETYISHTSVNCETNSGSNGGNTSTSINEKNDSASKLAKQKSRLLLKIKLSDFPKKKKSHHRI